MLCTCFKLVTILMRGFCTYNMKFNSTTTFLNLSYLNNRLEPLKKPGLFTSIKPKKQSVKKSKTFGFSTEYLLRSLSTRHKFHLVDLSPWPLIASLGAFMLTTGGVLYMHKISGGRALMLNGLITILYVMFVWWRDVIREATYEDQHTAKVQKGLRLGVVLFIISEVMFFWFFGFFHSSLSPVYT